MPVDFISYDQSVKLQELGFTESCFNHWGYSTVIDARNPANSHGYLGLKTPSYGYSDFDSLNDDEVLAPTWHQAFRFFRDIFNLKSWIHSTSENQFYYAIVKDDRSVPQSTLNSYKTYEDAESACLDRMIQLANNEDSTLQTKLIDELDALTSKMISLENFKDSDKFLEISLIQQHLLEAQSSAMDTYAKCLIARISDLNRNN